MTLVIRIYYLSSGREKHPNHTSDPGVSLLGAQEGGKVEFFCLKESRFDTVEILACSKQTSKPTNKHQKMKLPNQSETRCSLQ